MKQKTQVHAEEGKQEILISREFELDVELLFKAYAEAELVEQWMGTKVLKLENRKHGSYQFETSDPSGNVVFRSNGTIHDFIENKKITRTFEMENTPFPVQLEYLEFEKISEERSKLSMHVVYKSVAVRDQILQLPFVSGINRAHSRLQEIMNPQK
jgi:uncharacterized protein YndB with AHSA1/START domain